jgi:hypothetical protein
VAENADRSRRVRANEDLVAELLSEFREKAEADALFRGQMLEFKATTERRLNEGNNRMTAIDAKLAAAFPCPAHATIIQMLNDSREELDKKTKKDEEHDKAIAEVDKKVTIVEYKLTTSDVAKVVAIITPLTVAATTLLNVLIQRLSGA